MVCRSFVHQIIWRWLIVNLTRRRNCSKHEACFWICHIQYISHVVFNDGVQKNPSTAGADSISGCNLTITGNPIVEKRRSYDRLIDTMGFPILVYIGKTISLYWIGLLCETSNWLLIKDIRYFTFRGVFKTPVYVTQTKQLVYVLALLFLRSVPSSVPIHLMLYREYRRRSYKILGIILLQNISRSV